MKGVKTVVLLCVMLALASSGEESATGTNQANPVVKVPMEPVVQIGDTEADVLRIKGQPFGARTAGSEKTLFYSNSTVILDNGYVSNIKGAEIKAPARRPTSVPKPKPRELSAEEKRIILLNRKAELLKLKTILEANRKGRQQSSDAMTALVNNPTFKGIFKSQSITASRNWDTLILQVDLVLIEVETDLEKLEPELKADKQSNS